jgi:ATP-dependent exoDNAse (exonuclease V) beta subunit
MAVSKYDEFELLLRSNLRPTAAERGTSTHLFLQYCNYEYVLQNGIEKEIVRLLDEQFINERTASILTQGKELLQAFFESDFFARMQTASRLRREVQFSRFVPLATLTSNSELAAALGDRQLLVQGSIDLICEFEDGHIEICDYKTDRITKEERADLDVLRARMQEKHGAQLRQYAAAVQNLYHTLPSRAYIYSLPLGEAIEIDIS